MHTGVKKYLEEQPTTQKEILEKIRTLIQRTAPEAEEAMSYGVPAFKMTKNVVLYAAFKHHVGIYPEPATIEVFEDELKSMKLPRGPSSLY